MSIMDTCYTRMSKHRSHFTWRLENFPELLKFYNGSPDNTLKSAIFITKDGSRWYMKVNLTHKTDISFHLCLDSSKENASVPASYNVYIMGLNKQLFKNTTVYVYHYLPQNVGFGFPNYMSRDDFGEDTDLLVNGNLELHCEVTVVEKPSVHKIEILESQYVADFAKWYQNPQGTDWLFTIGLEVFNVHSFILQSRSPVFAEFFAIKVDPYQPRSTEITHIRSGVFAKLLEYIYTDNVTNIQDCAVELLVAADEYKLKKLKNFCERQVFENININNASSTLIIADRHDAQQLFVFAAQYIIAHKEEVVKTTGFQEIEQNHKDLLGKYFKLL